MIFYKIINHEGQISGRGYGDVKPQNAIEVSEEEFYSIEFKQPEPQPTEKEIQDQRIADLEMALAEVLGNMGGAS